MGQYNGAVITTAGQAVIAQAIGGAELTITKVVTSATAIPPGTDLTALTTIADVEQTAQPTSVQVFNDNIVQISTRFSNAGVAAAYLIQTLGVFGQVTGGAETLLAVSTAITPDQMPAEDAIAPSAFIYNIQLTVQSADQITVTVNDAGTATVEDVRALDAAKLGKSGDGQNVTVTFDETADPDVTSFATFLSSIVSGLSLSKLLRVIKTGLSYIAPKNHAANDVAYGGATATKFGHVVLSDVFSSADPNGAAANSMGASQNALNSAYSALINKISVVSQQVTLNIVDTYSGSVVKTIPATYRHCELFEEVVVNSPLSNIDHWGTKVSSSSIQSWAITGLPFIPRVKPSVIIRSGGATFAEFPTQLSDSREQLIVRSPSGNPYFSIAVGYGGIYFSIIQSKAL